MKASWIQTAAAAVAILVSVGSANAATYDIDFSTGPFAPVLLTEGTIEFDWTAPAVVDFDAVGYTGVTVVGSSITASLISVSLSYASSLYTLAFQPQAPGNVGEWGLFSGLVPSFASLLSYGSYSSEEVVVPAPVPLPAAAPLLLLALGGMTLAARRRKA